MSNLFWLTDEQMARLRPFFPKSHGKPRDDDRRVLSGIRSPSICATKPIDTVLEPGMVISMEPMLTIPEGLPGAGGYREHDILTITKDGAENITGYPYGSDFNVVI